LQETDSFGDHPGAMADRKQLIRDAFAGLAAGDVEPIRDLFTADARWVGVPSGEADTAMCPNRAAIVDMLQRHLEKGRGFVLGGLLEEGDRVAAEVTIRDPEWSGPVTIFKVFTFRPGEDKVVRLNDCIDESYARQVLAA
jgi:ketosteroid isomerase-like protein